MAQAGSPRIRGDVPGVCWGGGDSAALGGTGCRLTACFLCVGLGAGPQPLGLTFPIGEGGVRIKHADVCNVTEGGC